MTEIGYFPKDLKLFNKKVDIAEKKTIKKIQLNLKRNKIDRFRKIVSHQK